MLLYLNDATFVGESRRGLTDDVRDARARGIIIVMAHENDAERGGCPFSRFFETTPPQLVEGGLYKTLAQPLYSGEHRTVGLKMLAIALGAEEVQGAVSQAAADARTRVKKVSQTQKTLVKKASRTLWERGVLRGSAEMFNETLRWTSTRLSSVRLSRSGVAQSLRDRWASSRGTSRDDCIPSEDVARESASAGSAGRV